MENKKEQLITIQTTSLTLASLQSLFNGFLKKTAQKVRIVPISKTMPFVGQLKIEPLCITLLLATKKNFNKKNITAFLKYVEKHEPNYNIQHLDIEESKLFLKQERAEIIISSSLEFLLDILELSLHSQKYLFVKTGDTKTALQAINQAKVTGLIETSSDPTDWIQTVKKTFM